MTNYIEDLQVKEMHTGEIKLSWRRASGIYQQEIFSSWEELRFKADKMLRAYDAARAHKQFDREIRDTMDRVEKSWQDK